MCDRAQSTIGVIVPVYNTEKYLQKCLDSIIGQTYSDLEIVLVDDGSTDNCGKICDEYAAHDDRIIVIHQANGGLSAARNAGIEASTSPYITFVDSDDYIDKDTYESAAEAIRRFDPDLVFFRERSVDLNGNTIYINGSEPTGEITERDRAFAEERIIGQMINGMCDKVYRSQILKPLTFETGRAHGEDFLFNLHALSSVQTVAYVDQIKYSYVTNPDSITRRKFTPAAFDQMYFKDRVAEYVEHEFPVYYPLCRKRAFLARLRICRPLYSEHLEKQYAGKLQEINAYLSAHKGEVWPVMTGRERIEYRLYTGCKPFYRIFLWIVSFRRH